MNQYTCVFSPFEKNNLLSVTKVIQTELKTVTFIIAITVFLYNHLKQGSKILSENVYYCDSPCCKPQLSNTEAEGIYM